MRARVTALGTVAAATVACSLLTNLDDLRQPSSDGAPDDAAFNDGGMNGSDVSSAEPLGCDASGLVAFWPMNEDSGAIVHDCVQHLDGVIGGNSVTWRTRDAGGYLEFSNDGYVSLGTQSALELPGPLTVAGWVRSDNGVYGTAGLFWNYDLAGQRGFEVVVDINNNVFANIGFGDSGVMASFPPLAQAVWTHLALAFDPGRRLELYVNGSSVNLNTSLPDAAAAMYANDARMGAAYVSSTWHGGLADVRIYARALATAEIALLAN